MYGLAIDTVRKKLRTKTTQNNGINPTYENGVFEFRKVRLERSDIQGTVESP